MAPKGKSAAKAKADAKKVAKKVGLKESPSPKAPPAAKRKAGPSLDQKEVRDLLGHLKYHGGLDKHKSPKNVDPQARAVLTAYHSADTETKAAILEKFKGPGGKKLTWATDFIEKESEATVTETATVENKFTMGQILQMNGVDPQHIEEPRPTMILIRSIRGNYKRNNLKDMNS
jgi:hypothetical protein